MERKRDENKYSKMRILMPILILSWSVQAMCLGVGIEKAQWAKLRSKAMKPVPWNSVPPLNTELMKFKSHPMKLIGRPVVTVVERNAKGHLIIAGGAVSVPNLSRQERLEEFGIRNQIIEHFKLIRKEARLRRKAEFQYQLDKLKREAPRNAMGWQVNQSLIFTEKDECSSVTQASYAAQRKDLRLVAIAFRGKQNRGDIVVPAGVQSHDNGAVYGIVVGISSHSVARKTPQLSLPSGQQLRSQAYQRALQKPDPPDGFLANISALKIPSEPIPACIVHTVKILYCAISPKYFYPKKKEALKPVKGYVFQLKNGTKMDAKTYIAGDFYYHLAWRGINLLVAKDLVVKIDTIR